MLAPCAALVLAATSAAAAPASAGPTEAHRLRVTAWALPSATNGLVDANAPGMTTLAVDGLDLAADGDGVTRPDAAMRRLGRRGHHDRLTTELTVSNDSNSLGDFDPRALHLLLSSASRRSQVAHRIAGRVRGSAWDGVNVDFEGVRAADGEHLVDFVRRLRSALPRTRTVSIDVGAATSLSSYRAQGYRLGALAATADVVDLMTYDEHGPGWSGPGPIGALTWQRSAARTALRRVPRGKLRLGFGGYGYLWREGGGGWSVSDAEARADVAGDGVRPQWRASAGEWTATLHDGSVLWWADARSYRLRLRLARSLGVSGLAVWRLGSVDTLR